MLAGPEKLIIGKFCALGTGVRFIMNGANHRMDGPSTFPFPTMGGSWSDHFDLLTGLPSRGDTAVGNDVWFGNGATVMPGVRIGHGAIISTGSVVTADVPDYGIVGGNPARLIRSRYTDEDIARLLAVAWWDWPLDHLTAHVPAIMSGTIADLEAASPQHRPALRRQADIADRSNQSAHPQVSPSSMTTSIGSDSASCRSPGNSRPRARRVMRSIGCVTEVRVIWL